MKDTQQTEVELRGWLHAVREFGKFSFLVVRNRSGLTQVVASRAVLEGLGDVLVLRGKYDEAIAQFNEASSQSEDELVLARLDLKLAEIGRAHV